MRQAHPYRPCLSASFLPRLVGRSTLKTVCGDLDRLADAVAAYRVLGFYDATCHARPRTVDDNVSAGGDLVFGPVVVTRVDFRSGEVFVLCDGSEYRIDDTSGIVFDLVA